MEELLKNKKKFSRGKRSVIFTAFYKGKKVAIKKQNRPDIKINLAKKESSFLKILNQHKIGPKLIFSKDDYFVYEFVDGLLFKDWVDNASKNQFLFVVKNVLKQCYTLDELKINKKEMNRPIKHIIINKNKLTMVDFERCYKTKRPKNVTQFFHFLMSKNLESKFKKLGIKLDKKEMLKKLKKYKESQTKKNFDVLIKTLQ